MDVVGSSGIRNILDDPFGRVREWVRGGVDLACRIFGEKDLEDESAVDKIGLAGVGQGRIHVFEHLGECVAPKCVVVTNGV